MRNSLVLLSAVFAALLLIVSRSSFACEIGSCESNTPADFVKGDPSNDIYELTFLLPDEQIIATATVERVKEQGEFPAGAFDLCQLKASDYASFREKRWAKQRTLVKLIESLDGVFAHRGYESLCGTSPLFSSLSAPASCSGAAFPACNGSCLGALVCQPNSIPASCDCPHSAGAANCGLVQGQCPTQNECHKEIHRGPRCDLTIRYKCTLTAAIDRCSCLPQS